MASAGWASLGVLRDLGMPGSPVTQCNRQLARELVQITESRPGAETLQPHLEPR